MAKKAMEVMTESMFYVLMAFLGSPRCGMDAAAYIEHLTEGRVQLGPGTLYTILAKFEEAGFLREVAVEGRKRTYELTDTGFAAYRAEVKRLGQCLTDAQLAEQAWKAGRREDANTQVGIAPLPAL